MTEYIKREVALADFEQCNRENPNWTPQRAKQLLVRQPAADVAEVVRCKNCKWFADNNGGEWYGCQMFQVVRITPEDAPKPDDFCSHGERKEDSPCES
jgi:hypothetical protein